ncbi:hypothetical protein PIB30_029378 [Stylosanthes scabra]|uniref:Uncharacterized protein n=1 Tax=Stylosanthes scabra TaxID=79078 RepID=A0ABU6TC12_9FABA|nr:hypothetical protein [Stylosanthes scabra]
MFAVRFSIRNRELENCWRQVNRTETVRTTATESENPSRRRSPSAVVEVVVLAGPSSSTTTVLSFSQVTTAIVPASPHRRYRRTSISTFQAAGSLDQNLLSRRPQRFRRLGSSPATVASCRPRRQELRRPQLVHRTRSFCTL